MINLEKNDNLARLAVWKYSDLEPCRPLYLWYSYYTLQGKSVMCYVFSSLRVLGWHQRSLKTYAIYTTDNRVIIPTSHFLNENTDLRYEFNSKLNNCPDFWFKSRTFSDLGFFWEPIRNVAWKWARICPLIIASFKLQIVTMTSSSIYAV
jgi:hypothetical protein